MLSDVVDSQLGRPIVYILIFLGLQSLDAFINK